jgi:hypothetical protein
LWRSRRQPGGWSWAWFEEIFCRAKDAQKTEGKKFFPSPPSRPSREICHCRKTTGAGSARAGIETSPVGFSRVTAGVS